PLARRGPPLAAALAARALLRPAPAAAAVSCRPAAQVRARLRVHRPLALLLQLAAGAASPLLRSARRRDAPGFRTFPHLAAAVRLVAAAANTLRARLRLVRLGPARRSCPRRCFRLRDRGQVGIHFLLRDRSAL